MQLPTKRMPAQRLIRPESARRAQIPTVRVKEGRNGQQACLGLLAPSLSTMI